MNEEQRQPINGFKVMWQLIGTLLLLGFLAAIFFPVYTGGGIAAPRVACLSNIKQNVTALMIYTSDSDDVLPPYFTFDGEKSTDAYIAATQPYTKNLAILLCPEEKKTVSKKGATKAQEGMPGKMDYVHSLSLRGAIPDFASGGRQLKLATLKDPSVVPFMRDPIRGYGTDPRTKDVGFLSPHGAGFAVSFVDGHARIRKPPDTNKEL